MAISKEKRLDPRLRRLVESTAHPGRLAADLGNRRVTTMVDLAADAPVTAEVLAKRVLVRLASRDVPGPFADLQWVQIVDNIYTVSVPVTRLEELARSSDVQFVEAGRLLGPVLETSVGATRADRVRTAVPGFDGTGVVVGIIDFGFDFTLADFRNPDGSTRVAFLWDQTLAPAAGEASPARFGHGVEYDRATIDAALAAADPFAVVRHDPERGSHGTHVAGIAAGNGRSADAAFAAGRFLGTAPGATIVFVQPDAADQNSTFTDSVHVAEAIAYVFEKAEELGLPCAINMSLGQNGGSHDGESVVERAMDRLLERPGRAMVLAAGNEHIFRGHAAGTLAAGGRRTLAWKFGGQLPLPGGGVLPPGQGDFTPNEIEIWYSSRDVFRVRLTDPSGEATAWVAPGDTEVHTFATGDIAFLDSERFAVLNGDARVYVEVSRPAAGQILATGVWQVEIEALESRDGRFDAWIERDARRASNRFADQSFFLGADFDGVRTLGTPATARRIVAVANYDHVALAPADSSGRGGTRDGRNKPEVAAPGTDIRSSCALGGRPEPGNPAAVVPVRIAMSGTSMAAPHVAGIAALLLQREGRLTSEQIRKLLIAAADPPPGVAPFDPAWGFGRVDAQAAVALVGP